MIGYWVSFALLFPVILIGATAFKIWAKKKSQMEITPAMDQAANGKIFRYVLFYWLCNLFYMACLTKNLVCKYVFGGLILSIIFMNLVTLFTFPKEKSKFEKWGLLQDFLVGIGLSVYLIYIIPNDEVKTIVIPIVAATFGGLLTLVGVAWTIRNQKQERLAEEKERNKPRMRILKENNTKENNNGDCHQIIFTFENEKTITEENYHSWELTSLCFENFDNANFTIESILINCSYKQTPKYDDASVKKGERFEIIFDTFSRMQILDFEMQIKDIRGYAYTYAIIYEGLIAKGIKCKEDSP